MYPGKGEDARRYYLQQAVAAPAEVFVPVPPAVPPAPKLGHTIPMPPPAPPSPGPDVVLEVPPPPPSPDRDLGNIGRTDGVETNPELSEPESEPCIKSRANQMSCCQL